MANPPVTIRLRPVEVAYLEDLSRIGGWGKGKAAVARRFVEAGIRQVLRSRIIEKRDGTEFGEEFPEEDDED
jgi:hypothetical protein